MAANKGLIGGDMKMTEWCRRVAVIGAALCVLYAATSADAEQQTWQSDSDGNWTDASRWAPSVPRAGDSAVIGTGATVSFNETLNPVFAGLGIYDSSTLSHSANTLTLGTLEADASLLVENGGTYNLSGVGVLIKTRYEVKVGLLGQGYFNQGENSIFQLSGALYLGEDSDPDTGSVGLGIYTMTGGQIVAGPTGAGGIVLGEWGGRGEFHQFGGSVYIDNLSLARQENSSGMYELSGTGSTISVDSSVRIGERGTGEFLQTGGTHSVMGDLVLGGETMGAGTYTLQDGTLSAKNLFVGENGIGTFNQSSGSNYVGFYPDGTEMVDSRELIVGRFAGSNGTYNMTGGTLHAAREIVGDAGSTGRFDQSGDSQHVIYEDLIIGQDLGSVGDFTLSGNANLNVRGNIYLGDEGGTGTFMQTGSSTLIADNRLVIGTRSENGSGGDGASAGTFTQGVDPGDNPTVNVGILVLGEHSGTQGTYELKNGKLSIICDLNIGYEGTGIFYQSGNGTVETASFKLGNLAGSKGIYNLSDGFLNASDPNEWIGGNGEGIFNQTGGTNLTNALILGGISFETGTGTYNLDAGILEVINFTTVGNGGTGTFNQGMKDQGDGGTFTTNELVIGSYSHEDNQYNLGKGTLTVRGKDGYAPSPEALIVGYLEGTGTFTQTGGIVDIYDTPKGGAQTRGNLLIAYSDGSSGTYNLRGGTLNAGNIINNDQFNYSGGELSANVQNNATGKFDLSGGTGVREVNGTVSNAGEVRVTGTEAVFAFQVENTGRFRVTNSTVTFNDTFVNGGAYISDPSTNKFQTLEIGENGYLQGGAGDSFLIALNLLNASTRNDLWQTGDARLGFTGTGCHTFEIAGIDKGASMDGYSDNFAWSTLAIEGSLSLTDGNEIDGGAQYVRILLGVLFDSENSSLITNLFAEEGLTIYYLASLADNAYLRGLTYELGGGTLAPLGSAPVPIPSAVWLLASGLVGLIGLKRKVRKG